MVRTRVGYSGGTKANPTYRSLGDHSETIQIDYDPARISYEELLEVFWASHNPATRPRSRQYASIIFYHDDEQKRLATETRDHQAARHGGLLYTEILPFSNFYLAEAYHQKYRLQQVPDLMAEFRAIYDDEVGFVNSTVAARVNGYLGGHGTQAALQTELHDLGLSPTGKAKLLEIVSAFER